MRPTPLRRVLAATNGSEAGQHAARFAERLAQQSQSQYRVLSVAHNGLPGYPKAETAGALGSNSISARGIPGIEIARAAGDWPADLVVIGRRPLRADEELGPTIEALLRRLLRPCLLIPPQCDEIHRMLVALDGTLRGLRILPAAAQLAERLSLDVDTVHVVADPLLTPPEVRLREALDCYPAFGVTAKLEICSGPPVETILAQAATSKADLLVVGVRRGGPPGEAGSGHIGRDLLRRAPTAILTVPI